MPASEPAPAAERRLLTVLFCDLVGSTGQSARLDPEDLRDLIAAYRQCVSDAVKRFDGFIAQFLGDGVLVYFGYPKSHEDDAERAVRAGLAAVAAIANVQEQPAGRFRARIGIATGIVVVGEQIGAGDSQERLAVGETPNLAARLQAVAAPGEVVIAASTRRLIGRLFDCRPLGTIPVKGLSQPVEAWQIRSEAAGVSRFEGLRAGAAFPIVGRQEEIDLLMRRWGQAKAGEGRVVVLSGEPGIGKSRIAESLLSRLAGEPHARFRYFCSPHHTQSALHPFITQLERAAELEKAGTTAARLDRLEALLTPLSNDLPHDLALIADLLQLPSAGRYPALTASPQQKREQTFTMLLDHLAAAAQRNPVLIVFEDAHWIDPTSLDLIDRTVSRLADLPVLLIVTVRPEMQPSWVGQPHVTLLPLSRLGARDSLAIVAGVTNGKALPDGLAEQLLARTDGVPLFIEEVTRTLLESGVLSETPDAFVLNGPLTPLAIPSTLQASLVARLDRLAPVKDVAQIGAVIGREFSHELLTAVAAIAPDDLDAALERLLSSGLLARRGTPPDATYSFKHALMQDAAYSTLLKSRRQQLHASIARHLTERLKTHAEGPLEIVARHFTEAGLAPEAISYWRKAGQQSGARWSNREAAESFTRALAIIASLPESRATQEQAFEILLELRTMLNLLGDVPQMLDRLRRAEELAEKLDDDQRRGKIGAVMANVHTNRGEFDAAIASGGRALEIATRIGDLRLQILSKSYLVQAHAHKSEHLHVAELAIGNLAALPPEWAGDYFGRPAPVSVFDLYYLIVSLAELGRFAEAAQYEARAIELVEPMQRAFNSLGLAYYAASTLHLLKGEWGTALTLIDRVIEVLRAGKIVIMLPHAVAASAWIKAQRGEADEALMRLRESEQLLERNAAIGIIGQRGFTYHMLGRACLLLGMIDDARRLGELSVQVSGKQPGFSCHARHLLGDVATSVECFDAGQGEAHYRLAMAQAEALGMRPLVAHCHFGLARLGRRIGRTWQARDDMAAARSMYAAMDMDYWRQQAEIAAIEPL